MSRATASNFLHPHLRRRSRSGVFEDTSPPATANPDGVDAADRRAAAAVSANAGAATIGPSASKGRLGAGRPGITVDRAYLHRPVYGPGGGGGVASAVPATSAAAGVAGRPRRMTHQATRLTIDPERARVTGISGTGRTPATATEAGALGGRCFLRTPSTNELQSSGNEHQPSSSERDSADGAARPAGPGLRTKVSATFAGTHRPLQAKLETSARPSGSDADRGRPMPGAGAAYRASRPSVGGAGTRLPTWRTQQAVRESDERQPSGNATPHRASSTYTGVPGAKAAVRESSSQATLQEKSGDEGGDRGNDPAATRHQRLRPTQSKPSQVGAGSGPGRISSSVSAIGIGSYNSSAQPARPAPRAGAAASTVGAVTSVVGSAAPAQPAAAAVAGQGVRSHVASYQQRFGGPRGGPSSVVSAAPAPTKQTMHAAQFATANAGGGVQTGARQQPPPQPTQPPHPAQQKQPQQQYPSAPSRAHSVANSLSRQSGPISSRASVGGVPPLTPQEATARFGQQLSGPERIEILDYPHVYYVGNAKTRMTTRNGFAFDDERGDYIIHLHDHMLYRYELLEVLGKGSFGQVLRARDHKTGDVVAIKIIRNRKRFHHQAQVEVKLLECLRRWDPSGAHNILQMTASFHFRNHLCIVMELLSINLYEWLKAHQFAGTPVPLLRHLSTQMLQSLLLMSRHRIIHADLKPENILLASPPPMPPRRAGPPGAGGVPPPHPLTNPQLSADMQRGLYAIKVIDLGSSCFENERVYTYIQSRFYRAPEVILGLPYGPGIDMWSLGCIAVELLTGHPLFPGENEREQLACIIEVLGPPPAYMLERAPRCADFAEPVPFGVQAAQVGGMLLLPNGACVVGSVFVKPFSNSKNKRRRPGSRPLGHVLAQARDPRLVDFVLRTLAWDPAMRMSPEDALRHPWIADMPFHPQQPMATPVAMMQPGYVMMPGQPGQPLPPQGMAPRYMPPAIPQQPPAAAYSNVGRARRA
ncbi:serine/threonine protein kinase, CMGC, dual-specificity [Coemansia biformis]|uniref:dual-specificity kinase n=1 Tax=Coemansia biformis TaxID=1286918 RepID=A0A9W8D177_9FUNG|nr:serine/threonine protein kinase, CMGC, dual-specificity [Coemansia biformis]